MARRRRIAMTKGKVAIRHADTNITNVGAATAPATFNVLETQGGARTVTGGTQTITSSRDTGEVCNVGDIVKYVNLFMQCGPRQEGIGITDEKKGWMEWAFVCVKESETTVPITDIGIQTLGCVCNHMFQGETILTGAVPIGLEQPNYVEIKIKIPSTKSRIQLGDEWRFIHSWRPTKSTAAGTSEMRVVKSFMYKSYN